MRTTRVARRVHWKLFFFVLLLAAAVLLVESKAFAGKQQFARIRPLKVFDYSAPDQQAEKASAGEQEPADTGRLKEEIKQEVLEELKTGEAGLRKLSKLAERFEMGLLLEFGGVWEDVEMDDGTSEDRSNFAMTTVELAMGVQPVDWISGEAIFLYEDPTFDEETNVDIDVGTITIGNTERFPLYTTGGVMYVPFGALYTHFPDDPLVDLPLTLVLGETREEALLVGFEYRGASVSAYAFNEDLDKADEHSHSHIESYGFDAHYTWAAEKEGGLAWTVGASYISNIADSDGVTDVLKEKGIEELEDYVGGFDVYLHLELAGAFFLAEYMSATEEFDPAELEEDGDGARPAVWNFEAGYNWNWWRNLEICLKYAGSDEGVALGLPEHRTGLNFNQELYDGVVFSLGYLYDHYEDYGPEDRDHRNLVFGQVALEL
ncbi:MAG: LbtU family siderophore porin [Syntrophobacteria bacterium]